ncbi:hypothetical protein U8V72_24750 [Priestia filamentosa]|uniref:hypothetical protein n=1 Tax=Priestia filamentosa TaxID=1402861 RepID=UPI0039782562
MNSALQEKIIATDYPKSILQHYFFKGYDLKNKKIVNHLNIVEKALTEYLEILANQLFKHRGDRGVPINVVLRKVSKMEELQRLLMEVTEVEKKQLEEQVPFKVYYSDGEAVNVSYENSWEYLGFEMISPGKLENFLLKHHPRILVWYETLKIKRNVNKVTKSVLYRKYIREEKIQDKKILAFELLNQMQKIWINKDNVEVVAKRLQIEIVKLSDLDNAFFKKKPLSNVDKVN